MNPPATSAPEAPSARLNPNWILFAIACAALLPRIYLGMTESVTYDGYWHVFTATQDRWANMVLDYKSDAHPILYYILLRWVAHLGHLPIVYRSVSIIPGAAAAFVIGKIAQKVCVSIVIPILAAAAYAFAITSIDLSIDVRSYMGSLFFVLLSFDYFLDALALPERGRAWVLASFFASVAIGFEYYAAFYLAACIAVIVLMIAFDSAYRSRFLPWARLHLLPLMVALLIPLLTIRYFYRTHLSRQPNTFAHLGDYYWNPSGGESRGEFLLKNLQNIFNYFLPISISNRRIFFAILASLFFLMIVFSLQRSKREYRVITMIPVFLLLQLMLLGLARRYPFGGEMRQMSILAPFLCISLFVLIDRLIALMSPPRIRSLALWMVAIAVACSAYFGWRAYVRYPQELFTADYERFLAVNPAPETIYLDQFSLIGYFIHTHNWAWHSDHRLKLAEPFEEYRTDGPNRRSVSILRDRQMWNADFSKPATYLLLAQLIRDYRKPSLSVFHLQQFGTPLPAGSPREQRDRAQILASQAGLRITMLSVQGNDLFVTFAME